MASSDSSFYKMLCSLLSIPVNFRNFREITLPKQSCTVALPKFNHIMMRNRSKLQVARH